MNSEDMKKYIKTCIASQGKNKGYLKTQPPKGPAEGAWCALMLVANPYKISPGRLMMLSDEARAVYEAVSQQIEAEGMSLENLLKVMDKDRETLESLSAW